MLHELAERLSGWRHWTLAAVLLMCGHLVVAWTLRAAEGRPPDDFDRYFQIARGSDAAGQPHQVEHAPVATAYFKVVASTTGTRKNFRLALIWAAVAADVVVVLALGWSFGALAAAVYAAVTLPLLTLYYLRFDLLPTMLATIAIAAYRRGLPVTAAVALVAGVGFKLWPLPLSAVFVRRWRDAAGRRATVAFVLLSALLGVLWMGLGGVDAPGQVATFRGATGWHVESLVGGFIAWWNLPSLRLEADGWRIGYLAPLMSTALLVLAAAVAFWLAWNGASNRGQLGVTWLASVTALLLIAPALSPQYMVWLAPAIAIAWREGDHWPALLTAATVPLTLWLLSGYGALIDGQRWAALPIISRNLVLVVAGVAAAAAIWQTRRPRAGVEVAR
jgi:hypothetical protein